MKKCARSLQAAGGIRQYRILTDTRLARPHRAAGAPSDASRALKRLRRDGKPASVPVLVADGLVVTDSFDIALWAAAQRPAAGLVPEGQEDAVRTWNSRAESALAAGRVLSLQRTLQDEGALMEMVPPKLRWLGPLAVALSAFGVRRTLRKYRAADPAEARTELAIRLDELRAALSETGGDLPHTLLGSFSLADICAAQMLAFGRLPGPVRLNRASRLLPPDTPQGAARRSARRGHRASQCLSSAPPRADPRPPPSVRGRCRLHGLVLVGAPIGASQLEALVDHDGVVVDNSSPMQRDRWGAPITARSDSSRVKATDKATLAG